MDFGLALMNMYPNINRKEFDLMQDTDGTVKIIRWDSTEPQPTEQSVIDFCNSENGLLKHTKELKTKELTSKCEETVAGGFQSSALGVVHTYPSHDKAQTNFNTEMHRFLCDDTYSFCYFATVDSGFLKHTRDQFFQVFKDGHDFGNSQYQKLAGLIANVENATTDQLNEISW